MILAPCAFAIFSSKDKEESHPPRARFISPKPSGSRPSGSWRATNAQPAAEYDLILPSDPTPNRAPLAIPEGVYSTTSTTSQMLSGQRARHASKLLNLAADAEAQSIAAQVYAAQANKAALEAAARAASARAAAATALAAEAEKAVAEAARMADAVRRAYETAPPSVGPQQHALPETHPSMDFPRSHVIRRAA